jgi:hypothetical protein
MRYPTRSLLLIAVALVALSPVLVAQSSQALDRFAGTWRLNLAKSKYAPGPGPKSQTVAVKVSEGGFLAAIDTVNAEGQQTHIDILAKFDGRDHVLKGATQPTTWTLKWMDDYSYEFVTKVNGKTTTTTRVSLSRDGKVQTVTTTGTNAQGQPVNNSTIFERQ